MQRKFVKVVTGGIVIVTLAFTSSSLWNLVLSAQPTSSKPASSSAYEQSEIIWNKAKAAITTGNTKAATHYATLLLKQNTNRQNWNYGNIIHNANQVLGMAALRDGDVANAKRYLLAAAKTPGSPQLDSFGPRMVLAQQLLDRGEKDVVIQYLDKIKRFWGVDTEAELKQLDQFKPGLGTRVKHSNKIKQQKIATWKNQIRSGKKPKLHRSSKLI